MEPPRPTRSATLLLPLVLTPPPRLLLLLLALSALPARAHYYDDYGWQSDAYQGSQRFYAKPAVCVSIPNNLRLCQNIGYAQMRLPNLLEHESLPEVQQQAGSWVPLLAKRCHPDTQLFLCSLFAPVCLDRPIYPCRSLCQAVRDSCAPVMESFGFPWPDMLRCDKFPIDNDLCIAAQSARGGGGGGGGGGGVGGGAGVDGEDEGVGVTAQTEMKVCPPCDNEMKIESVLEHYCASEFAIKMKIKEVKQAGGDKLIMAQQKKRKVLKPGPLAKKDLKKLALHIKNGGGCPCQQLDSLAGNFLIMGRKLEQQLLLTAIYRLDKKNRELKNIIKKLKNHKCPAFHSTF